MPITANTAIIPIDLTTAKPTPVDTELQALEEALTTANAAVTSCSHPDTHEEKIKLQGEAATARMLLEEARRKRRESEKSIEEANKHISEISIFCIKGTSN